jgi:hypothetical protein
MPGPINITAAINKFITKHLEPAVIPVPNQPYSEQKLTKGNLVGVCGLVVRPSVKEGFDREGSPVEAGVLGIDWSESGSGVFGDSASGHGVSGLASDGVGVYGECTSPQGYAGYFNGRVHFEKNVRFEQKAHFEQNVDVKGTVKVDGDVELTEKAGDIAEEFDVQAAANIEPGSVLVIGNQGTLCISRDAYDRRVAGVVAGAGDFRPAITLDRQAKSECRLPISLVGKTYCKIDCQYGAIEIGSLLTTSPTPGHAMRVDDVTKAVGAIIGKALSSQSRGKGLIPILVTLQ